MSLLVWRQMNDYYLLGTDGLHSYTVSRMRACGAVCFLAWRIASAVPGEKPAELLEAFDDQHAAKTCCARDLARRTAPLLHFLTTTNHHNGSLAHAHLQPERQTLPAVEVLEQPARARQAGGP